MQEEEESQWRDWWEEASVVNMESILMCLTQNVKTISEHPQRI